MEKAFEELQIKDDFMFGVIMRNPKFCKPFLERVLGIRIERIEYPKSQETIDLSAEAKSVRLDIYVEDEKNSVYNIEMQTVRNKNIPKRSRYYQGMIDLNILEKGDCTAKVILNTKGTRNDITPELKNLLNFVDGGKPEDDFTKELDEAVQSVRKNEKRQTALRMLEDGDLSLEKIAQYSGLSLEKIQELNSEMLAFSSSEDV